MSVDIDRLGRESTEPAERGRKWGEDFDPSCVRRSGCVGQPQPEPLREHHWWRFIEHGGGTRASFNWTCSYYYKALHGLLACRQEDTQSGRWNAMALGGMWVTAGYLVTVFTGTFHRVYSRNSLVSPIMCTVVALAVGMSCDLCPGGWTWAPEKVTPFPQQIADKMDSLTCPQHLVFYQLADNFQTLTNFILGLYVTLVLSRIYYAQRIMLGTSFGGILGFCMRLLSSCKSPDQSTDSGQAPVLPPRVKQAQRRMIRWANAIFRLLWLESCEYETQINRSIHVMEGNLGPLLTKKEWARIKNVPSRCTHILYWLNHSVDDLKRAGYLDSMAASELANQLNEIRSSNNYGLSSLPYPYVFTITSMTKLMMLFFTLEACFRVSLVANASKHAGDEWNQPRVWLVICYMLQLMVEVWMYQALLDLYILLRNPNQGRLCGHMPTPDFLQFTEAVTCEMMMQQDTAPRPLFVDSDDDTENIESAEEKNPLSQSKGEPDTDLRVSRDTVAADDWEPRTSSARWLAM